MNRADRIVAVLLEDELVEGSKWKSLATAGLLGAAALHAAGDKDLTHKIKQGYGVTKQAVAKAVEPRRVQINDPDQPLPSEKDLTPWEYVEKKAGERDEVAQKLGPFADRFIRGQH